ncbi:type II toxin-antitoxin system RelE/ParE family toxin [Desulfobulbus alkaliphilus]|uniref:type II toxin-antitoxin system RelE/ParE family toxin n=1 Tax=Desulfobulbus alkaliphilus TaxID=869814 RepID=UPI001964A3AE|nr:type II toxin-antitoxin system RelE/ParE family toxin [Desulfobulbus alkaliphilus]MBM9538811.1 type II toxin-antitoxin system RelE/ParE family toxin [Desulfobulbus alkaliphilus]
MYTTTEATHEMTLRVASEARTPSLQSFLMLNPEAGAIIKGSGGLRKVRWNLPGEGKRSALRVIYYFVQPETIYMVFLYKKNQQEDLTPEQIRILKKTVEENLL